MGEIIYWKKFDEPKIHITRYSSSDGIEGKIESKQYGVWCCSDERVDIFNLTAALNPSLTKKGLELTALIIFKNGEHYIQRKEVTPDTAEDTEKILISQAEEYLKSLK